MNIVKYIGPLNINTTKTIFSFLDERGLGTTRRLSKGCRTVTDPELLWKRLAEMREQMMSPAFRSRDPSWKKRCILYSNQRTGRCLLQNFYLPVYGRVQLLEHRIFQHRIDFSVLDLQTNKHAQPIPFYRYATSSFHPECFIFFNNDQAKFINYEGIEINTLQIPLAKTTIYNQSYLIITDASTDKFLVWDIENPSSPRKLGSFSLPIIRWLYRHTEITENYFIYKDGQHLLIIDLSQIKGETVLEPIRVDMQIANLHHFPSSNDNYNFICLGADIGQFKMVDVRNPQNVNEIVLPLLGGNPFKLILKGSLLFLVFYKKIEVWDWSTKKLLYTKKSSVDFRNAFMDGNKLVTLSANGVDIYNFNLEPVRFASNILRTTPPLSLKIKFFLGKLYFRVMHFFLKILRTIQLLCMMAIFTMVLRNRVHPIAFSMFIRTFNNIEIVWQRMHRSINGP